MSEPSYEAGTTTPKATYSDADGTTENANPVVLDSSGRAVIFLSGSYKIVVKTSAGTTFCIFIPWLRCPGGSCEECEERTHYDFR